jgi:hypothetical protein
MNDKENGINSKTKLDLLMISEHMEGTIDIQ